MELQTHEVGSAEWANAQLQFTDFQSDDIGVREYEHMEIHETIEELMVVANSVVAQKVFEHFPSCALLRKHEKPLEGRLEKLKALCEYLGIEVDLSSNKMFAKSIAKVKACCNAVERDLLMTLFRK